MNTLLIPLLVISVGFTLMYLDYRANNQYARRGKKGRKSNVFFEGKNEKNHTICTQKTKDHVSFGESR